MAEGSGELGKAEMQMTRADLSRTLVGRALAGAFAGGLFGLIAQPLIFWDGPPEHGIRLPVIGPVVGAGMIATLAVAVGGRTLPDWLRRVAVGVLGGVVVGAFWGSFVYAPLMASLDNSALRSKAQAAHE